MRNRWSTSAGRALVALGLLVSVTAGSHVLSASAAEAAVDLGTAKSFAVLAASTVTNTGPSVISGDLGVSPGNAVTGFGPGIVINGTIHAGDALAAQAQEATKTAYDDAAGRSPTQTVSADLGGAVLVSGVYTASTSMGLTGTVTLDAQGDPTAVFIFQAGTTLTTASGSTVSLVNGASPCNVYWKVGSSATLGTNSVFVGTILALESITATTDATVAGRLLARTGAVTLDSNDVTAPLCAAAQDPTPTTDPTATTAPTTATTAATEATPVTAPAATTGTVEVTPTPATGATPAATTPTTARPAGTTSRGTNRTSGGNPPLADTGWSWGVLLSGTLLVLVGAELSWLGRRPFAHSSRAHRPKAG